jgi:hypothetical protein
MPLPLSNAAPPVVRAAGPGVTLVPSPRPAEPAAGASFRDHLAEAARSLAGSERSVDRAILRASHGRALAPEELLVFQATIYQHSLKLDLASKLVEKATTAVKQTLQSQT